MRTILAAILLGACSAAAAQAQGVSVSAVPAHANARDVVPAQALAITRQLLVRIDDAMKSGNYSVLRDLAAPSLRETQTPADLAQMLEPLRARRVELVAATILEPTFTRAVVVYDGTQMVLAGHLPTAPMRIEFEFVLRAVNNNWQVSALAVKLAELPKQKARETSPQTEPKSKPGGAALPAVARNTAR